MGTNTYTVTFPFCSITVRKHLRYGRKSQPFFEQNLNTDGDRLFIELRNKKWKMIGNIVSGGNLTLDAIVNKDGKVITTLPMGEHQWKRDYRTDKGETTINVTITE